MTSNKDRIRQLLEGEGPHGKYAYFVIYSLIAASVMLLIIGTMQEVAEGYSRALYISETVFSVIFLFEYVLRVWSSPHRLRYIFSFWGIIDLLASLPVLLVMGSGSGLYALKSLRLLRMAQIFKLLRVGRAHRRLVRAFVDVKDELFVFTVLTILVLMFASSGIYYFEHDAQPDKFSSIPASFWWAVATFTTVGYGDVYPVTSGGRAFTILILFIGLAIVAVPTGIYSAALMNVKREGDEDEPS